MEAVQRYGAPRYAVAMSKSSKAALARQVWSLMFDFLVRTSPQRAKSLGRRGLTPNDSRALAALDQKVGRTMRSLAEDWECDASNATWVVDRLERLGLATRRAVPGDRRVRHVVLTAKGRRRGTTSCASSMHRLPIFSNWTAISLKLCVMPQRSYRFGDRAQRDPSVAGRSRRSSPRRNASSPARHTGGGHQVSGES